MNIYLSLELAGHRRGRFLTSLLRAEVCQERLPLSGCLLAIGEQFQVQREEQLSLINWSRQPGCALLLLPPYQEGKLTDFLDWSLKFLPAQPQSMVAGSISARVSNEVVFEINGRDGGYEPEWGHEWAGHSLNTKYWKAHSNSGVLVATTLPLWSISLLEHQSDVLHWLEGLYHLAGKAANSSLSEKEDLQDINLSPQDYSLLVCCYGWGVCTERELDARLKKDIIPIFDFSKINLQERFDRLGQAGLIDEQGISDTGVTELQSSSYWFYAQRLKEGELVR